jgi:hypothetical protein
MPRLVNAHFRYQMRTGYHYGQELCPIDTSKSLHKRIDRGEYKQL